MSRIDFAALPWTPGREGVRFKSHREGNRQFRLVEFSTSEGDTHWCDVGHEGYVIAGGLDIEVDGKVVRYVAGDALALQPGTANRHRGVSIIPGTVLFMIEDA